MRKTNWNGIFFLMGLILVSIGAYLVYPPAGLIAPGLVLMLISTFGERVK